MQVKIRAATEADLDHLARLHSESYPRQFSSRQWVRSNFHAYPRIMLFAAEMDGVLVGYIQWIQKSGFRKEAVLELEQIAVTPTWRNQHVGTTLIKESLQLVDVYLQAQGSQLKSVIVTTRTDNHAQQLYKSALGAMPQAVIKDLYSHDEVIMIANLRV